MKIQVIKPVGWLTGLNGTGVIYLLMAGDGTFFLGMINATEQGEKWIFLSYKTFLEHKEMGKADINVSGAYPVFLDWTGDYLTVENPEGWPRLYTGTTIVEGDELEGDEIKIPFSVKFEGKMTLKIPGFESVLKSLFSA